MICRDLVVNAKPWQPYVRGNNIEHMFNVVANEYMYVYVNMCIAIAA